MKYKLRSLTLATLAWGMIVPACAQWTVTNLHPTGADFSGAYGVSGGQQVGYAHVGLQIHASLWSGTAASWVDLNPGGSTYSVATSVSGGQQVGYANLGGMSHASLWSGTAASWVDLSPAGSSFSYAYGVSGGQQVGYAVVGVHRASLWSGTAASWVDLSAFLPGEFTHSFAQGVWSDASFTYVAGYGFNAATGRQEALLWTVPEPSTILVALSGLALLRMRKRRTP